MTQDDSRPLISRGGLHRLSTGLIAYGLVGLLVAGVGLGALVWVNGRIETLGARVSTSVDAIATTLERTAVTLENASTTADSFTGTIDRTVDGVSSAAGTISSVRSSLETLESGLRAVTILGLTPLGAPAEAVGGIANAIEGLDTRLTAIADSLAGNRDALATNAASLARVADSTSAMAERLRSGVIEDSLADVQLVVGVILFLMVAWTAVPAVGSLWIGLWLRRELRRSTAADSGSRSDRLDDGRRGSPGPAVRLDAGCRERDGDALAQFSGHAPPVLRHDPARHPDRRPEVREGERERWIRRSEQPAGPGGIRGQLQAARVDDVDGPFDVLVPDALDVDDGTGVDAGQVRRHADLPVRDRVDRAARVAQDRPPEPDLLDGPFDAAHGDHVADVVLALDEDQEPHEVVEHDALPGQGQGGRDDAQTGEQRPHVEHADDDHDAGDDDADAERLREQVLERVVPACPVRPPGAPQTRASRPGP